MKRWIVGIGVIIGSILVVSSSTQAIGDSPNVGPVVVNRCDHGNRVYVTESETGAVALAVVLNSTCN